MHRFEWWSWEARVGGVGVWGRLVKIREIVAKTASLITSVVTNVDNEGVVQ